MCSRMKIWSTIYSALHHLLIAGVKRSLELTTSTCITAIPCSSLESDIVPTFGISLWMDLKVLDLLYQSFRKLSSLSSLCYSYMRTQRRMQNMFSLFMHAWGALHRPHSCTQFSMVIWQGRINSLASLRNWFGGICPILKPLQEVT